MTSLHIKHALMNYFRYKRQWVCADEVASGDWFIADILVDTGKWTMEVEIKTSKNDLIKGEAKKTTGCWTKGKKKHEEWKIGRPNKFALCVPESMEEIAEKWIEETNPKYGLYIYYDRSWVNDRIWTKRSAKMLHDKYGNVDYKSKILKRLSSCRTLELQGLVNKYEKKT